jgi:hypothetical protein
MTLPDLPEDLVAKAAALRNWGKRQFSLDPQPEQDLLSPETAGDMALGMIPGVGQAMALRDMERARRAEDPVAGGLAAASLLPFGKLIGAVKNKLIGGSKALKAPIANMEKGEAALRGGADPDVVWETMGVQQGMENHRPMQFEIPDQRAKVLRNSPLWKAEGEGQGYFGDMSNVFEHPEGYANYPHMGKTQLLASIDPTRTASEGAFHIGRKGQPPLIEASAPNEAELRKVILHEMGHDIGALEGFDKGASYNAVLEAMLADPKYANMPYSKVEALAFNKYQSNIGEAVSRNIELRADRPAEVNASIRPSSEYDVPTRKLTPDYDMPGGQLGTSQAIRPGGDPDLYATHAGPINTKAGPNGPELPGYYDDPSVAIKRYGSKGPAEDIPFYDGQEEGAGLPKMALALREGALDPKNSVVDLFNRDAYTFTGDRFGGKRLNKWDPESSKLTHAMSDDLLYGTESAQGAGVALSPKFRSLKQYENSPTGAGLLVPKYHDYSEVDDLWRSAANQFGGGQLDVPDVLQALKEAAPHNADARHYLKILRNAPSEYGEAKIRGKFPLTSEKIAGVVLPEGGPPDWMVRGAQEDTSMGKYLASQLTAKDDVVKALRKRGIPFEEAPIKQSVEAMRYLVDKAGPFGGR